MLALTQESRVTQTAALFANGALARGRTVRGIPLSSRKLKDGTAGSDEGRVSYRRPTRSCDIHRDEHDSPELCSCAFPHWTQGDRPVD